MYKRQGYINFRIEKSREAPEIEKKTINMGRELSSTDFIKAFPIEERFLMAIPATIQLNREWKWK